jgi:hypothetical protein
MSPEEFDDECPIPMTHMHGIWGCDFCDYTKQYVVLTTNERVEAMMKDTPEADMMRQELADFVERKLGVTLHECVGMN